MGGLILLSCIEVEHTIRADRRIAQFFDFVHRLAWYSGGNSIEVLYIPGQSPSMVDMDVLGEKLTVIIQNQSSALGNDGLCLLLRCL